ncbi:CENP-S associating centromere protein X-domain-containing protein [Aspergillus filifer]
MPPERQTTQKRRHLPFKPPSRASGGASAPASASTSGASKAAPKPKKTTKPSTTASSSKTSKPISRTTKPKPAKPSSSRQRPSPSPSHSHSASASDSNPADSDRASSPSGSNSASDSENEASEANYILAEITHPEYNSETEDVLSSDPLIPPKLLTKLVHHHFKNEKTKIAKDANGVVAKYIDVFVREAVARAAFERAEGGAGGDGFLEVEDLEKMGPQLAMDF